MNPKIQAFCAAFRELQREGGLQKSDIYRIASRYGVNQDELAKALLSADSFVASEILDVNADHLNEALERYGIGLDPDAETVAPIPTADLPPIERSFANALQAVMQEWPIDPGEREEALHRVAEMGAIKAVKSAINESSQAQYTSLWGFDRLDLTFEAVVLCPAWKDLFSDEERALTRERLNEARVVWESLDYRPAKTFRDTWVFWVDGRPVGSSHRGRLQGTPSAVCEMFSHISNFFGDTGQFAASLSERRHYRRCKACSTCYSLDEVISLLDKEEFRRLRILLSTMPVLLNVPLCWETVTALAFIDRECDVDPRDWVSGRQGKSDRAFSDFVQSLDTFEFFGVLLAKRLGKMFGPPALCRHGELLLPSDIGFPPEPGVLDTSLSAEDWNRFREMQDRGVFGERPGAGIFDDPQIDFRDLMHLAVDATNFEVATLWEGNDPEYLVRTDLQPSLNRRLDRKEPNQIAAMSLRKALGGHVCDALCLEAYMAALEAERFFLDENRLKSGTSTVTALARAFEHQFDYFLLEPWRKLLRDTPEMEPRSEEKRLVDEARVFTLSEKAQIVYFPRLRFSDLCKSRGVDLTRLDKILPDVLGVRNNASHVSSARKEYTPDEARAIRSRWFGLPAGDGGFFALLTGPKA